MSRACAGAIPARDVQVDAAGNLLVLVNLPVAGQPRATRPYTLTEQAPIAWQTLVDRQVPVAARYVVAANGSVGFALGAYDQTQPLIIDPTFSYSTYLGGSGLELATDIAVDSDGNSYITGVVDSTNFPTVNPLQSTTAGDFDVFVAKLNATGTALVYSTYLGGSCGDEGKALALDAAGNVYLTGRTCSNDFPTANPFQGSLGGGNDAFVTKLNPQGNGLVYSTYLGARYPDEAYGIAVNAAGNAYVTGYTENANFPTVNAYQATFTGWYDAFVTKFSVSGSSLLYSTFLAEVPGTPACCSATIGTAIAVDRFDNAYAVGRTQVAAFPTQHAIQPTLAGGYDAYLTKLTPSGGALVYSTYLGGSADDMAAGIAVDRVGNAYLTSSTWSTNFPTVNPVQAVQQGTVDAFVTKVAADGTHLVYSTYLGEYWNDNAAAIAVDAAGQAVIAGSSDWYGYPLVDQLQNFMQGGSDAIVSKLNAAGSALLFSSYLGGSGGDWANGIALDRAGDIYLTGGTSSATMATTGTLQTSNGGYFDAFVAKISGLALPPDQQRCGCSGHAQAAQKQTRWPVNTRTGNYWTRTTDLAVPTPGPALVWTRTYASQATGEITGTLGFGWQFPYGARLVLPAMPGGESGRVIVLSAANNRERFDDLGSGQYRAYPGIYSTLVQAGGVYTQTLRDQSQLMFDATNGRLTGLRDALGRQLSLTYSGSPARLTQITDAADSTRFLALTYSGDRIASIGDGTRTVGYGYSSADLTSVTDVMSRTTTYTYTNHLLTAITNPLGQTVEAMSYDAYTPAGRVSAQTLQDGQVSQFQYLDATTIITTTGTDGRQDVQRLDYAPNNTLTGTTINGQAVAAVAFDASFSPTLASDGSGNTTQTIYTPLGLPTQQTNALGQISRAQYDAQNRPLILTDTLGVASRFAYDTLGNVISTTLGITTSSPLRATTLYTYSYDLRYVGDSLLTDQRGPDGVVSHSGYNAQGQVITATVGYGTALAQTTTYGYDALGRVVTSTIGYGTALAQANVTNYNADNTVASAIQNYQNGSFDPAHPDEDIITSYGYDALGRQIWTRDALGHYDVTHYNAAGQVDWTARNFSALGWSGGSTQPSSLPSYTPSAPDANVATRYGYDGLGRTTLVTQTGILTGTFNTSTLQFSSATSRVTKTEYDALSRPITTTLDLGGLNLQTLTYYDGNSNPIWQRDALGRWTKTDYDALSRPVTTTVNYEDGNPLTGPRDADIVAVTHYDQAGRADRQTDNWVNGAFTATEPITDRVTLSAYDTLGRVISTTLNYAPGATGTDLNRVQLMSYDSATLRVQGQRDPLGRWVSQQYDLLGRVTATIQNCRTSGNVAVASGCASFSATYPDRNVPSETHYDAMGRAFETEDALGHVAHIAYDGLGRAIATIQNYVFGGSVLTDTNVTTRMAYDVLGRTTIMTDALGYASYSNSNGLGQTTTVTDTAGRVTRMGYDGSGALRWTKRNDGQLTVYQVDSLGRTVATIANYQDGTVGMSEPADQDLITRTVYDAAGRRTQTIDPASRATAFAYDNLDRLIAVTEHAVTGTCTQAPCNVITQYQYDRAGNRTAIIDANGHVRRFRYDAANQPAEARDALNQVTSWDYDAQGRVTTQHDPRGTSNDLTYSYDQLDRLTARAATNLGTIGAQYDALGRRTSLTDVTGTTQFGYDALGRMRSLLAPVTGHVGYDYDARGARTKLIYPDGTNIQYSYATDGQLQTVAQGAATLATYTYDSAGRLQQVARANGATTTSSYDDADRLTDLRTTVSSADVSRFQYTVDRLGQRTSATELLSTTRTISYTYDGLLRLTGANESPGATYAYSYDDAGNRTGVWLNGTRTVTQTFNAANQVNGYTYDAAGNLTNDGSATYTYDALSRMTIRNTTPYTYNGDGALVYDGTTRYTQDLAAPLTQVLQTIQGSATTNYLYGMDRLAAAAGSTRTWYVSDALGSVRQTLSDSGVPLGVVNYDPWGTPESGSVPMFGFTGELQDSTMGLVNLRARWYSTSQGTFTSRDTFQGFDTRPDTLHHYAYVGDNPINRTDPSGHCYGALEWLRNIEPENCTNLDKSVLIWHSDVSSP
jgi:RHS repeat-associated protein